MNNSQPISMTVTVLLHTTFFVLLATMANTTLANSHSTQHGDNAHTSTAPIVHGAAMHGTPLYGADFIHFGYVNPNAPKGGTITLHGIGSFDTFNPFSIKGRAPLGIGLLYDTLTVQAQDEPFSQYGLVAKTFQISPKRDWVVFYLDENARFSDGKPIQADDVIFTFNMLVNQGNPLYGFYYQDVTEITALDDTTVRFQFSKSNSELALILGQLPVLPKHFWKGRNFQASLTDIPIGSGPYTIGEVDIGKSINYTRRKDYWATQHRVNRGHYNFDTIRYVYFLNADIALEGFSSQIYDYRLENSATNWANAYAFPAVKEGKVTVEKIPHHRNQGMQAYVFNLRREVFQDAKVREAITYAFDFEWSNANLFYNSYTRSQSYFSNSELASSGFPSTDELTLLNPLREQIPAEVFTQTYQSPTTEGGSLRANLRKALQLLRQAGWVFKKGKLVNDAGEQMRFEVLLFDKNSTRIVNPIKQNLERIGIEVNVVINEVTQYVQRVKNFDYDMISTVFAQSESPGNEQRDFWHSLSANRVGSRNYIGIQNPAVDALIDHVIFAEDREALITATRALDRVLLWNHYVIPQFYLNAERIAYWNTIVRPSVTPQQGVSIHTWWAR